MDDLRKLTSCLLCLALVLFSFHIPANTGLLEEDEYGVVVVAVDAPDSAKLGDIIHVNVTIEYNFPIPFNISTVIWDPSVEDFVSERDDVVNGAGTEEYTFDILFPEGMEPGTYTYHANALYKFNNSWQHREEDWSKAFTVEIKRGGFSIPGFPIEGIILGLLALTTLLYGTRRL